MRRLKAGNVSVVPVTVPMSSSVMTGTKNCCKGGITVFWKMRNCIIFVLNSPLVIQSWELLSGKPTMMFARSSVTENFLKKIIPMRLLPIVGKIMNTSPKIIPSINEKSKKDNFLLALFFHLRPLL